MVYDSDFYTTRRSYRTSPSLTSYTISSVPSRQVRVLPGLGKVHVSYTYDRVVPYVGHKRLTVVTTPPKVFSTRPSVLQREYDRIENKLRPWTAYSATNRYLNSESAVRTYYISYPITGYNSYYSLNLPSSSYLPKVYRWYYSWPREYYSYWPYYRSYLTSYLRNYYLSSYWPSYYWSSYLPYYRSVDYEFSELENKIDNLRIMLKLKYDYMFGSQVRYYPGSRYYYDDTFGPLGLYWPYRNSRVYPYNWPLHLLDLWPTEHHLRKIRMLKLRYDPAYGSRYQYLPVPSSKYYWDFNSFDPLDIYEPSRYRYWYPYYWPSHLYEYIPTKYSLRRLRVRNNLYSIH